MPVSVHSGSVSWDKCGRVFPDKLHVSSFLDRFPHYVWTAVWSAHSVFIESQVYVCLHVTCHLHFQQDDQGLLHATAVTQRWNRHHIRVSTQLSLEKILLPLLQGLKLTTFRSRVSCYHPQAIPVVKHKLVVGSPSFPKTAKEWKHEHLINRESSLSCILPKVCHSQSKQGYNNYMHSRY